MPACDDGRMKVQVRLLGPVELIVDGATVTPSGVRPRAVLAVLAASGGLPVSAERLTEAVYSDTGRPASRTTVQVHVHTARQALGEHRGALRHTHAGYLLSGPDVDIRRAEDALGQARSADQAGDHLGAAASYRRGLALWRGAFCADLPDHTALDPARNLYAELRQEALEARIAADLRADDAPGLVRELEKLVVDNPLRERQWGQLMVALYRDGRQADALATFRQARRILAEEAGLDPGPALRELERAILAHAGISTLLPIVAPVAGTPGRSRLTWVDSDGRVRHRELPGSGRLVVGRDPAADVAILHDPAVSRAHAAIVVDGGRPAAVDLGSRNGTFRNGERIGADAVPLRPGDLLRCGGTVIAMASGMRSVAAVDGTTR